jgi:SAM-dependent methyltransferase
MAKQLRDALWDTIMERFKHRECPVCGNLQAGEVGSGPPRIVCCDRCGMVFNDVAEDVDYSGGKYTAGFEEWNDKRYLEAAFRIRWNTNLKTDSTILDVGCATGGLMHRLRKFEFDNVTGCDPSLDCCKQIPEGFSWWHGGLESVLVMPDGPRYDCVILSHVLEHIRDVASAMRKLVEVADSVYIEVPDGLRYCEHVKSPYQNWNREHVSHFDLEHLNMLFHAHGFQLRSCGEYSCEPDNFPAIWAWFTKRASLRERQEEYGRASANAMRRIEEQVKAIKGPVIAWGIGALARRLEPVLKSLEVLYAVDNNQSQCEDPTQRFCGVVQCGPKRMEHQKCGDGPYLPILVTTILYKDAVLADIKRLGLKNRVITLGD